MASDTRRGQAHGLAQVVRVERIGFVLEIEDLSARLRGSECASHPGDIDGRPGSIGCVQRQQRTPTRRSHAWSMRRGPRPCEVPARSAALDQRAAARGLDIALERTQLTGIERQIPRRLVEISRERRRIRQAGAPRSLGGEARQIHRWVVETADDLLCNQGLERPRREFGAARAPSRGSRPAPPRDPANRGRPDPLEAERPGAARRQGWDSSSTVRGSTAHGGREAAPRSTLPRGRRPRSTGRPRGFRGSPAAAGRPARPRAPDRARRNCAATGRAARTASPLRRRSGRSSNRRRAVRGPEILTAGARRSRTPR